MRFEEREQFCGKMQVQGDGDQLSVVSTEQRHGSIGSLGSRSMLGQRPVTEETVFTFQMEYQENRFKGLGRLPKFISRLLKTKKSTMSEQPTNPANTDEAAAAIDVQDGAGTDQIPENAELDLVMGNIDCNQPPEERVKTGHSEETLVNNDEELAQEVAAMEPQRLRNPLRVRIKRIPQHARQLGKMVQKDGLQKASANFRGWFFDTGINKLKALKLRLQPIFDWLEEYTVPIIIYTGSLGVVALILTLTAYYLGMIR